MVDCSGFQAYSEAAARNSEVILAQLIKLLERGNRVIEIGSGSGQHAVRFSDALDNICWQPTETESMLSVLTENLRPHYSEKLELPVLLDLGQELSFSGSYFDAVYTANTLGRCE